MASGQYGLGILRVKTILDDPGHIHYGSEGSEGIVAGNVILRFHPKVRSHKIELVGPLDLAVTFQGTIKAYAQKQYFPDTLKLFSQTANLHNGSFRADPERDYKFPFALAFPETADPRQRVSIALRPDADGSPQYRRQVTDVIVEDLPPTLSSNVSKNDPNLVGPGSGSTARIVVSYSISTTIRVPGINVVVSNPSEAVEVLYERPKIPLALVPSFTSVENVEMKTDVQDESLVPEHARPQGFRSKTKAFLNPTIPPKFEFDVGFSGIPKHVFVGQQISFHLYISERGDGLSDLATPKVKLDSCTVMLIAHTSSKDTATGKTSLSLNHEVVFSDRYVAVVPTGPFSNGYEHRKLIKAIPLGRIPSSFTHGRTQRSYTLRVAIQLLVGEQTVSRKRDFKVEVHPPFALDNGPSVEITLDRVAGNEVADNEAPPAYEEAIASSRNARDMPPSWEEAQTGVLLERSG